MATMIFAAVLAVIIPPYHPNTPVQNSRASVNLVYVDMFCVDRDLRTYGVVNAKLHQTAITSRNRYAEMLPCSLVPGTLQTIQGGGHVPMIGDHVAQQPTGGGNDALKLTWTAYRRLLVQTRRPALSFKLLTDDALAFGDLSAIKLGQLWRPTSDL